MKATPWLAGGTPAPPPSAPGSVPAGVSATVGTRPGGGATHPAASMPGPAPPTRKTPPKTAPPAPPATAADASRPAQKAPKVLPLQAGPPRKGGGVSQAYYKDLRPREYIADWIVALVNRAVAEIYGYNVPIMFPDHIRFFLNKGEAELERKNGMHVGTAPCLAPLLVKGNHWVLLEITPTDIRVQDSLRTHTAGQAKDFAHHLQEKIPGLRKARVYEDTNWPQQGYGTNDCALFVMRAILQRASGLTTSQVQREFSREFLDATLPRFAGTATSSKDQGALPETQQRQFIERLRRHLTPAVGSQQKPAVAATVPVDNAPAVKDSPAPQPIPAGTPPSAPAKDTKAATTGTAKGSTAVTAKSVAKGPAKAVASAEWVKCGQPKCKYDMGMVSTGSAWACSLCHRPFHPVNPPHIYCSQ